MVPMYSSSGVANQMSPMFSSFSEDSAVVLGDLFSPPHGYWLFGPFSYERVVLYAIVVCLLLPFAPITVAGVGSIIPSRQEKPKPPLPLNSPPPAQPKTPGLLVQAYAKLKTWFGIQSPAERKENWRPWTFGIIYLSSLSLATASLIALLILLLRRSEQLDPIVERKSFTIPPSGPQLIPPRLVRRHRLRRILVRPPIHIPLHPLPNLLPPETRPPHNLLQPSQRGPLQPQKLGSAPRPPRLLCLHLSLPVGLRAVRPHVEDAR